MLVFGRQLIKKEGLSEEVQTHITTMPHKGHHEDTHH